MDKTQHTEHWRAFDLAWFRRHQRILLWLVNTPLLRWWFRRVLRIHDDPELILQIWPNVVVYAAGNQQRAVFRTHDKFSKRLYYAFRPLWWLLHYWDELIADRWCPEWSYGFATLTAFPSPGTVANFDGYIDSVGTPWSTVRSGLNLVSTQTFSRLVLESSWYAATSDYDLTRCWLRFDTSVNGLLVNASISAGKIELRYFSYTTSDANRADRAYVFQSTIPQSETFLDTSYWSSFGSTQVASNENFTLWTTSPGSSFYVGPDLNSTGRALVNATGITGYCIRAEADVNVATPSSVSQLQWNAADQSGTSTDPRLVITYTGAETIQPPLIASSAAVYAPSVGEPAPSTLFPPLIAAESAVYTPTATATVTITPPLIGPDLAVVYPPEVTGGVTAIYPPLVDSQSSVYAPLVTAGDAVISPDLLRSPTAAIYGPTVLRTWITVAAFPDGVSVAGPSIALVVGQPLVFETSRFEYEDGGLDVNVQPCGQRRWTLEYAGLSAEDVATLRAHWNLARGTSYEFSFYDRRTGQTFDRVKYESFRLGAHVKQWSVPATIILVRE